MKQTPDKRQAYRARTKARAIEIKVGCCQRCGFADARALRLHHVKPLLRGRNGMRRQAQSSTASHLAVLRGAKGFRLLCANCSVIAQDVSMNANINTTRATKRTATRDATR